MSELIDRNYGIEKCLNCPRPKCTNCIANERKDGVPNKNQMIAEEKRHIVAMYHSGVAIAEIAKVTRHGKAYIYTVLRDAGEQMGNRTKSREAERCRILQMFDAGKNVVAISQAVGKSEKTVYSILSRHGRSYRKGKNKK